MGRATVMYRAGTVLRRPIRKRSFDISETVEHVELRVRRTAGHESTNCIG